MRNRLVVWGVGLGVVIGIAASVEAKSASTQAQILIIIPERRTPQAPSIPPSTVPQIVPPSPVGSPHAVTQPRVTDPGITASLTSDGIRPVILYTKIQ